MSEDHQELTNFIAPPLEELDRLLDGYHFESFIAQGGMGAVYLARQTSLDRQVAVKVLPREFSEDENFIKSFQSEAKLMAKLNHPNLIGIYDFGNIDGMLYIIMEFVKGKSLHHSAHGKAISQSAAVDIISAVCSGLAHAHDAGILHRDIKPANILLGKRATPKIGDFGLARVNGVTESGEIYGTPGYSAPEVLGAPSQVDHRTDIFAVGVMFYELLTGRMPEARYVSVNEYVESDVRFDNIIKKAINTNINMRYSSAQDFADEIKDVIQNPSVASRLLSSGVEKKLPMSLKANKASNRSSPVRRTSAAPSSTPAATTYIAPTDSKMMRNTIIILVLLVAIYAVLEMKKVKEKEVAETQEVIDAREAEKQKERERRAAIIEAERRRDAEARANDRGSSNPKHTGSDSPPREVVKLTPMEQLSRVKELLGNGERPMAMMPETIFMRDQGSRIIMFVDKQMTWDEADAWTREHGGYIAICKSRSDLTVFTNKMPEGIKDIWLGAGCSGDKGWSWVDDTPWTDTITLKSTYSRAFIKLSQYGSVGKTNGDKKLNFFIEWRADGSNPADLEYRLLRTSDSLTDINPKYPPGTITAGARSYCIIKSPVTFSEASELAIASAGHLIAISNNEEKYEVEGIIAEYCKSGDTFWTAAEKQNDIWGWQTGEKWLNLNWAPSYPKSENHVVITAAEKLFIKDVSSGTIADGFIIEWSKDKSRVNVANLNDGVTNLNGGLRALKNKAKLLVKKQRAATEKKHAYNVKKLWSDLETYLRTLPRNQSAAESVMVNQIIDAVKDRSRVPETLAGEGPSAKSRDYTNYAVEKQAKIDLDHTSQIVQLRNGYVKQLQKLQQVMEKKGQISAVKSINDEARSIGNTTDDFEDHFR